MKEPAMSVRSRRLTIAAVIAATAIAVPAAALASVSGPPSGKPSPPASASQPAAAESAAAAKSAAAASQATASGSAAASKAAARQSGALSSVTEPAEVAALAADLGVSHGAAQHALDQLQALNGMDPASPAFAAIAQGLGVSPDRLAAALPAVKQAARQAASQSTAGS
jgi:hypothetical protein